MAQAVAAMPAVMLTSKAIVKGQASARKASTCSMMPTLMGTSSSGTNNNMVEPARRNSGRCPCLTTSASNTSTMPTTAPGTGKPVTATTASPSNCPATNMAIPWIIAPLHGDETGA